VGTCALNVRGMAIVVFTQAIWFIVVGIQLWYETRDTLPVS